MYGTVFGFPAAAFKGMRITDFGAFVYVLLNVSVRTVPDCGVPVVVNCPQTSLAPAVSATAEIPVELVPIVGIDP